MAENERKVKEEREKLNQKVQTLEEDNENLNIKVKKLFEEINASLKLKEKLQNEIESNQAALQQSVKREKGFQNEIMTLQCK